MLAPQTTTYDVPNIGSVTVSRDGDLLRIDSTTAAPGYEAEVKCAAGTGIEVEFDSDGVDYEFRARVLNGQILTDVSSDNFPQPGVAGSGSPRAERREHDARRQQRERQQQRQRQQYQPDIERPLPGPGVEAPLSHRVAPP